MSGEGNAPTREAADEETLLSALSGASFEGEANNGSLRDYLGWQEDRYWQVRNRLLESGRVQKAHGGPGGKTVIAPSPAALIAPELPKPGTDLAGGIGDAGRVDRWETELSLYEPMRNQIDKSWARDQAYDSWLTRTTALAGSRDTGGKWTRPDISMVAIQKFKFLREPVFDVVSFEIKPNWQISVEAVFEALAHRQYTTRAYAVYHSSPQSFESQREGSRIIALAEQHGVGVILADDPSNYDRWVERVRARRWLPDPSDLNDFIQRVFPSTDHDEVIKLTK